MVSESDCVGIDERQSWVGEWLHGDLLMIGETDESENWNTRLLLVRVELIWQNFEISLMQQILKLAFQGDFKR